jgi:predicted transport protein
MSDLLAMLESGIADLGDVQEVFTKTYIGFRCADGGFASVLVQNAKLTIYARVPFDMAPRPPDAVMRDVSGIGHYGYGQTECCVSLERDLLAALDLIRMAYERTVALAGRKKASRSPGVR